MNRLLMRLNLTPPTGLPPKSSVLPLPFGSTDKQLPIQSLSQDTFTTGSNSFLPSRPKGGGLTVFFKGGTPSPENKKQREALLFEALSDKDPLKLEKLLKSGDYEINKVLQYGDGLIHRAVNLGEASLIKVLLENGADPNLKNNYGGTALLSATQRNSLEMAKMLLEKGANPNISTAYGQSSLSAAVNNQQKEMVELLLKNGADINFRPTGGHTPLFSAILKKDLAMAHYLIAKGAAVDGISGREDYTPLWAASNIGHIPLMKLLLDKGANPNYAQSQGVTPLMAAAESGSTKALSLLLSRGADINAKTNTKQTPLSFATRRDNLEILDYILDHPQRNLEDKEALNAAFLNACNSANIHFAFRLLKLKPDLNFKHHETGHTALMASTQLTNRGTLIEALLNAGADVNAKDKEGLTALHYVFNSGFGNGNSQELSDYGLQLLAKGANPNVADVFGITPLMEACIRGNDAVIEELINKGADPNQKDTVGNTALLNAATLGRASVVNLLLSKGAQPNLANNEGLTPLIQAMVQAKVRERFGLLFGPQPQADYPNTIEVLKDFGALEDPIRLEEEMNKNPWFRSFQGFIGQGFFG
jgi:ankyrin repeat protein